MSGHRDSAAPASEQLEVGPTRPPVEQDVVDAGWEALRCVYDPELCLDVVSLGLVYDVRDERGTVVVEMTLTTPGCPVSESLPEMARVAVAEVAGAAVDVEIRVVWDPPWNPTMMTDEAASALGFGLG